MQLVSSLRAKFGGEGGGGGGRRSIITLAHQVMDVGKFRHYLDKYGWTWNEGCAAEC